MASTLSQLFTWGHDMHRAAEVKLPPLLFTLNSIRLQLWLVTNVPSKTQADVGFGGAYASIQWALPLANCFLSLMQPTNHRTVCFHDERRMVESSVNAASHFMLLVHMLLSTCHNWPYFEPMFVHCKWWKWWWKVTVVKSLAATHFLGGNWIYRLKW